jgi:hypothetical protein
MLLKLDKENMPFVLLSGMHLYLNVNMI